MDFYNFFSFSAKKAVYRASEICSQFNCQLLEPEHVFYSLLNLRSCSAVQVLHQLGVNLPKLSYSLEAYLYEHAGSFKGNAVFSQRTINLLDQSYKEVKRLHHKEIGTTHLLIACSAERTPFMRELFEGHGLDGRKIRESFLVHLKGYNQGKQQGTSQSVLKPRGSDASNIAGSPPGMNGQSQQMLYAARRVAEQFRHPAIEPLHLFYAIVINAKTSLEGLFVRLGVDQGALLLATVKLLYDQTLAIEGPPADAPAPAPAAPAEPGAASAELPDAQWQEGLEEARRAEITEALGSSLEQGDGPAESDTDPSGVSEYPHAVPHPKANTTPQYSSDMLDLLARAYRIMLGEKAHAVDPTHLVAALIRYAEPPLQQLLVDFDITAQRFIELPEDLEGQA